MLSGESVYSADRSGSFCGVASAAMEEGKARRVARGGRSCRCRQGAGTGWA